MNQNWVQARRNALVERLASSDRGLAVRNGCAASAAARHADELKSRAALALGRLDAGLAGWCEECAGAQAAAASLFQSVTLSPFPAMPHI